MRIDLVFDTICPWCFIGKRQLDLLVAQKTNLNFEINYHSFFLNPGMPLEGMEYQEYTQKKFGGKLKNENVHNTINQIAKRINLEFDFSRIKQVPNSLDSHRMVKLASQQNQGREMLEALYESYFIMGRNIGDRSVLIDIGTKLGYDSIEVKKYLFSDKDIVETLDQNHSTLRLGISGIPAFIFDDKFSISGAQDNKVLLRMLNIAEDDIDDANMQNIQPYLKGKQDRNDL